MALVPMYNAVASGATANTTQRCNIGIGDSSIGVGVSAIPDTFTKSGIAGTFSRLMLRALGTNTLSVNVPMTLEINGSNGNEIITILTTTTNTELIDLVNTDTINAGDYVAWKQASASGTGSCTAGVSGVVWNPSVKTSAWFGSFNAASSGTPATRLYDQLGSAYAPGDAAETALMQVQLPTAGTLKNGCLGINTANNSTVYNWRLNGLTGGGNTNVACTVSAGTTGLYADNGLTDTVNVNDLLDRTTLSGAQSGVTSGLVLVMLETADTTSMFLNSARKAAQVYTTSVTQYEGFNGRMQGHTTESDIETRMGVVTTTSGYRVYVSADTVTLASTVSIRKNAGAGAGSINIPLSSTAGWYSDLVNSDQWLSTDEGDWQIVTGATGTSLTLNSLVMKVQSYSQASGGFFFCM